MKEGEKCRTRRELFVGRMSLGGVFFSFVLSKRVYPLHTPFASKEISSDQIRVFV